MSAVRINPDGSKSIVIRKPLKPIFNTEGDWLYLFSQEPTSSQLYVRKGVSRNRRIGDVVKVEDYRPSNPISTEDLDKIRVHINNQLEFLIKYYRNNLEPTTDDMTKEALTPGYNNQQYKKYKNSIRNLFMTEIYRDTKSGVLNKANWFDALQDLYCRNIIDYKLLTKTGLTAPNFASFMTSFFFITSIMNPFLVYKISLKYPNETGDIRVLTPTMGWCSYLTGFMNNSRLKEYVGIDVIPIVNEKAQRLVAMKRPDIDSRFYTQPSESLNEDAEFLGTYFKHFNLIYFSPPYYETELYPDTDNTQSTEVYDTEEKWLNGYWKGTLEMCHKVLADDGLMIYVIFSEVDPIAKKMADMTPSIGFVLQEIIPFGNIGLEAMKTRKAEAIYVWRKLM